MNYSVDWDGPGERESGIVSLIEGAPEPLKRLGERLADILDADHWNNVEPLLLEIAAENARLHSALRGATDYLECIDKAHPDLVVSIHGLFPIKEMVERYRAALGDQQIMDHPR